MPCRAFPVRDLIAIPKYKHACDVDMNIRRVCVQVPYRPASDPSALRASHSAPTPDSVEMPGVHGKRRRGQADTAERTAGAFQAAAARARNPGYRGYNRAERRAGLAGEGAQVRSSLQLHHCYKPGPCFHRACQADQVRCCGGIVLKAQCLSSLSFVPDDLPKLEMIWGALGHSLFSTGMELMEDFGLMQVPQASYAGRLAGEGGSPEVEGAAAAPTYNGATEDGDGVDDEAAFSAMRRLETLSDEVVMSNNVSAMCIGSDDTNAISRALRVWGGAQASCSTRAHCTVLPAHMRSMHLCAYSFRSAIDVDEQHA